MATTPTNQPNASGAAMMKTLQQKPPASNAVARQGGRTLREMVEQMSPAIKAALPAVMTPERFTRIALSALSSNPALQKSTPQSFLAAMMTAAQLGLEPNTPLGQAYLIPFKNHGIIECQFQIGYKGLIDLAFRSGDIKTIQAHKVCENDLFEYEYGLTPKLRHVPAKTGRGAVTHYYAVFETKNGGVGFTVMSREDVLQHAKEYSKAFGNGPWQTNFNEMAKKTALKACLKYAPLKSDFVRGLAQDEAVRHEVDADMTSLPKEVIDVEAAEPPTEEEPNKEEQPAKQETVEDLPL